MNHQIAVSSHALAAKIPPGDDFWREFNGSFVNRELDCYGLAEAIFEGHAFTTQHSGGWRHSDNFQAGQHLGLDFDHGDATLASLGDNTFISRYASILYTTPRHTPEAPRARVVFLLDAPILRATNYALAAQALLWLFGTADRACRDAARFWYGSLHCDFELPDNVLPLATMRHVISQYQVTGRRELARQKRAAAYQPTTTDEQDIVDALAAIPPWSIAYDQWLAVLMAVHAARPDNGGLAMAEAWADGKQGEVERKWRGFKATGNVAGRVGPGTLFAIAKEHGWAKQPRMFAVNG